MSDLNISRRKFLAGAAAVGAAGAVGAGTLSACSTGGSSEASGNFAWKKRDLNLPPLRDTAPAGKELKAGVVGCGGRGSGAAIDFVGAGPGLTIVALGDVFQDRVNDLQRKLNEQKGIEVPDENCFVGFDAYQKVIDAGVDVVILATPPKFRPEQFEAAVKARKHVFMEKPVAVDPVGIRQILAAAKMAESLDLKIATGTQRRHQHKYIHLLQELNNNAIGEIVAADVYWNGGQLWYRNNQPDWSEMEWMIRDWVNWCWLSGDHIVEQHIHNIDVAHWYMGKHPIKALGFGSRQRRVTGDQYDNFAVDFVLGDGRHVTSTCRQINGCANGVYELFHGTKAMATSSQGGTARIFDAQGNDISTFEDHQTSPFQQEHIDLVTCIRENIPLNEAEQIALSTMVGIMGRVSAYTGKEVTFEEMMNSDLKLGPEIYVMGDIGYIDNAKVPVPGSDER